MEKSRSLYYALYSLLGAVFTAFVMWFILPGFINYSMGMYYRPAMIDTLSVRSTFYSSLPMSTYPIPGMGVNVYPPFGMNLYQPPAYTMGLPTTGTVGMPMGAMPGMTPVTAMPMTIAPVGMIPAAPMGSPGAMTVIPGTMMGGMPVTIIR